MHMDRGSLDLLGPTRATILFAIKRRVEATAEAVAAEAHLSVGATRQHLTRLEVEGFVTRTTRQDGAGRPPHLFRLTEKADALFATAYAKFAMAMMSAVSLEPPEVQERISKKVSKAFMSALPDGAAAGEREFTFDDVVDSLAQLGYLPNAAEVTGTAQVVRLDHCPLFDMARQYPSVCAMERDGLRALLGGSEVTRTAWRLEGDAYCAYRVERSREATG